jgi:hypothetical protein
MEAVDFTEMSSQLSVVCEAFNPTTLAELLTNH